MTSSVAAARIRVVDKPGGPSLREQIASQERANLVQEKARLAACPTEEAREALLKTFIDARRERGEKYAALICSQGEWAPKPGASPQSQVLTAYYRLLGKKARAFAAKEGRPVSLGDLDRVKLSRDEVRSLRAQFGDDAVKKALPSLKRHIFHARWLSAAALRFMESSEFVVFHMALDAERDQMDRNIDRTRDKLDEKDAERLRESLKDDRTRRITHWTERVVVEHDEARQQKITYASVGGRLVPVDEKPE